MPVSRAPYHPDDQMLYDCASHLWILIMSLASCHLLHAPNPEVASTFLESLFILAPVVCCVVRNALPQSLRAAFTRNPLQSVHKTWYVDTNLNWFCLSTERCPQATPKCSRYGNWRNNRLPQYSLLTTRIYVTHIYAQTRHKHLFSLPPAPGFLPLRTKWSVANVTSLSSRKLYKMEAHDRDVTAEL